MSLARALVQQVQRLRRAHGMVRVVSIDVGVGELAGVEAELLRSAYALLAPAAGTEGARLHLTEVPLLARCRACGGTFRVERFRFACPACAAGDVAVLQGESVILQSVTFEAEG